MKLIPSFIKNNKFLLFIIFYLIFIKKCFFFINTNNINDYLRKYNNDNLIKYFYILF